MPAAGIELRQQGADKEIYNLVSKYIDFHKINNPECSFVGDAKEIVSKKLFLCLEKAIEEVEDNCPYH
jgi:hypothetical protein